MDLTKSKTRIQKFKENPKSLVDLQSSMIKLQQSLLAAAELLSKITDTFDPIHKLPPAEEIKEPKGGLLYELHKIQEENEAIIFGIENSVLMILEYVEGSKQNNGV